MAETARALASVAPHLVADWHPTLNKPATPSTVRARSEESVWWRCHVCGHEWKTSPRQRFRGGQCPPCIYKKNGLKYSTPKPGHAFSDRSPHLVAEWHPTKNGSITPDQVKPSSGQRIWWKCSVCEHEWVAPPARRTLGKGCPACNNKQKGIRRAAPVAGQSLEELHPRVVAEWHPTRNGNQSPASLRCGSGQLVWWRCIACQHEWQRPVRTRTSKDDGGCPMCRPAHRGGRRVPILDGSALAQAHPDIAAEWHPTRNGDLHPSELTSGSDHKAWWRCGRCGHEWKTNVYKRTNGKRGCPPCANAKNGENLKIPQPGRSLADVHPHISAEWHPTLNIDLSPSDIRPTTRDPAWWIDKAGHEWQESPLNRTRRRAPGCRKCGIWGTSTEEIRLRHELVAAGVPVAPHDTFIGLRPNGHELRCDIVCEQWRLVIEFDGNRFHRLPRSAERDRRKTRLLQDLGWAVIRLREDLPPISPHDVTVPLGSNEVTRAKAALTQIRVFGFEPAHLDAYMRTADPWARTAANAEIFQTQQGVYLIDKSPALALDWHPTKNDERTPHNTLAWQRGQRIWWKCHSCAHEWETLLISRLGTPSKPPTRCPACRCTPHAEASFVSANGDALGMEPAEFRGSGEWADLDGLP